MNKIIIALFLLVASGNEWLLQLENPGKQYGKKASEVKAVYKGSEIKMLNGKKPPPPPVSQNQKRAIVIQKSKGK